MDRVTLGNRLTKLREESGLTLKSLGARCGGWGKSRVGNYEKAGEKSGRMPKIEDLFKMLDVLAEYNGNDTYFYLFTGKKIPEFLEESNYKVPYVDFTPVMAKDVLESVLDIAQEVGMITFSDKEKVDDVLALFTKKCSELVNSKDNRKAL